jgi:hypothetical protein
MRKTCGAAGKLLVLIAGAVTIAGGNHAVRAQSTGALLFGVTTTNRLIAFRSSTPAAILGAAAIGNLAPG